MCKANTITDDKGAESMVMKTPGNEIKSFIISVLADRRNLPPLVNLKRRETAKYNNFQMQQN
jgi:hypothetical protein